MRLSSILSSVKRTFRKSTANKSNRRRNVYRLGQFSPFESLEDRRLLAIIDITVTEITTNTQWNSAGDTYRLMNDVTVRNNATLTIGPNVTVINNGSQVLKLGTDGSVGKVLGSDSDFNLPLDVGQQGILKVSGSTFDQWVQLASGATPVFQNNTFADGALYVAPELIDNLGNTNTYGSTAVPDGTIFVLAGAVNSNMSWPALPGLIEYYLLERVFVNSGAKLTIAPTMQVNGNDGTGISVGASGSPGQLSANNVNFALNLEFGSFGGGAISNSTLTRYVTVASGANPVFQNDTFGTNTLYVVPEFIDNLGATNTYGSIASPNGAILVLAGAVNSNMSWPALPGLIQYYLLERVYVNSGAKLTIAPTMQVNGNDGTGISVGASGSVGNLEAIGVNFQSSITLGANAIARIEHSRLVGKDLNIDGNIDSSVLLRFNDFSSLGAGKIRLGNSTGGSATHFDLSRNFWGTTDLATIDSMVVDDNESALRPTGDFAPIIAPGTIGRVVWKDVDQDGIQDSNEPGVAGIGVKLFRGNNTLFATTTTAASGAYAFQNVPNGNFYVEYTLTDANRQIFTLANKENDYVDSDVTGIAGLTGRTPLFSFQSNYFNYHMDAGLRISEPPVVDGLANVSYTENAPAINISPAATVADVDSSNFALGELRISITSASDATDRLGIRQANGLTISGNQVLIGGQVFGTFSGGVGSTPLTVLFDVNSNAAKVQTLLRNVTYRSTSENPALTKTVTIELTDGDGGTSSPMTLDINIQPVNDKPTLSVGGVVSYSENAAPVVLAPIATINDPDSADFDTGVLTLTIASGGNLLDRLGIRNQGTGAGQIGVSGNDVTFGGALIGTKSGGDGLTPLQVTLNASATLLATRALLRNTTFETTGDIPSATQRSISISLSDGDNATSDLTTKLVDVVTVNDAPVLASFGNAINYTENAAPIRITNTVSVTDVDSSNFDTGTLTVRFSVNGKAEDRLTILNAGNISTVNNEVQFAGVTFGTWAGGVGLASLIVTLNDTATPAKVQSLLRNIVYSNVSDNPNANARTLSVRLKDGDGGTSSEVTKPINIVPVNDASVISGIDGAATYTNNTAGIFVATSAGSNSPTALVSDVDSPNFDQGKLTIRATQGASTSNRIELSGTAYTLDASNNILRSGVIIGSLNANGGIGLAKFEVTFNAQATAPIVQQLLRCIKFRTTSTASTAQRILSFTLTDGDGGTSNTLAKTIDVT